MKQTTSRTTAISAALALTLSLGLAACSDDPADAPGVTAEQPAGTPTGDATDDATDDDATDDDDDATDDDDDMTGDATGAAGASEGLTALALSAIATAEDEVGGTAYAIDDQDDDGTWEIDLRVGDRSHEVTVAQDGASGVEKNEEDDLDDDDRAGLDAATITIAEAIEIAIDEVGGVLDDAELGEDDGRHSFEVTLDGTDRGDDVDVKIDVATGEVIEIDG